jgi:hypothetical protein
MEIEADGRFIKSLKRLRLNFNWAYRIWETVRYDIPRFFKNIWMFRRSLWEFRWYSYGYPLNFMRESLEVMADKFEHRGNEVRIPRMKKVAKMKRAIEILERLDEYSYIEMAEKEVGDLYMNPIEFEPCEDRPGSYRLVDNDTPEEKEHNGKVYARAREIEEQEWRELWKIFKGQDSSKFDPKKKDWEDWYDGSGMKHWWD